jgi:hypothetical protein
MSDLLLLAIVTDAAMTVRTALERDLPAAAPLLVRALRRVPPLSDPAAALSANSFPIFALPYWMTPPERRAADAAFLTALSRSTYCGYYGIRLVDNVMDRDGPEELSSLLPAASYFNWRFVEPYLGQFDNQSVFWSEFSRLWSEHTESTVRDSLMKEIGESEFFAVSARKFTAAKVPLSAVAHRAGNIEAAKPWHQFVDRLGVYIQFLNDFLDWRHDAEHGIETYLQSESRRRRHPGERHEDWFEREGVFWATDFLRAELANATESALSIECIEVDVWLSERQRALEWQVTQSTLNPKGTGAGSSSLGDRMTSEH